MYNDNTILVAIQCFAFNHEKFIRDCLDGFISQKTDFKFIAVVHDDASTDKTAEIIREYYNNYPDIILPIFETENQYSKPDGSLNKIMDAAIDATGAKYVAICEGDDYWTDPYKLQKQVDFLEEHEECQMCCSDAVILTKEGNLSWKRYDDSCIVPVEDVICGGGLWLQTVTYVYRSSLFSGIEYPECCKKCHVGDYPLIIWAALNGGVGCLSDITSVYRYQCIGSWTDNIDQMQINKRISGWRSEINMLKGLDEWSGYVYHDSFKKRIREYLYNYIIICNKNIINEICAEFMRDFHFLSRRQRVHIFFLLIHKEGWFIRLTQLV